MELILALIVGGGCAAWGAIALRRRRKKSAGAEPPVRPPPGDLDRGLESLRPDDVINIDHVDWIVVGVADLSDGATRWQESRLVDGDRVRWLVVDSRSPDSAAVGERCEDLLHGGPPSESLEHEGKVYRLARHGQVKITVTGDAGAFPGNESGFWDYSRPGDGRLWLRGGEGSMFSFAGRSVRRHLVTFLPGS